MNEMAELDAIWAYETEIKHNEYYGYNDKHSFAKYHDWEEDEDEECE